MSEIVTLKEKIFSEEFGISDTEILAEIDAVYSDLINNNEALTGLHLKGFFLKVGEQLLMRTVTE